MFLTINKTVIESLKLPNHASFLPLLHNLSWHKRPYTHRCIVPVNIQNYSLGNSSVTPDIAKIDNYSVFRQLGNNICYFTILERTQYLGGCYLPPDLTGQPSNQY